MQLTLSDPWTPAAIESAQIYWNEQIRRAASIQALKDQRAALLIEINKLDAQIMEMEDE